MSRAKLLCQRRRVDSLGANRPQAAGVHDFTALVSVQVDALADDPGLLKAMLIAERMESERLRQIVREFQRHRFWRRAESLSEDQLQLALEDTEQQAVSGQAKPTSPNVQSSQFL